MERPASPAPIYRARLIELEPCWLDVKCGACGHATLYPFKLLAARLGPQRQVGEIVSRLRCKECRGRPATIYLNETPHGEPCKGAPPGWSMQLFPPPLGSVASTTST